MVFVVAADAVGGSVKGTFLVSAIDNIKLIKDVFPGTEAELVAGVIEVILAAAVLVGEVGAEGVVDLLCVFTVGLGEEEGDFAGVKANNEVVAFSSPFLRGEVGAEEGGEVSVLTAGIGLAGFDRRGKICDSLRKGREREVFAVAASAASEEVEEEIEAQEGDEGKEEEEGEEGNEEAADGEARGEGTPVGGVARIRIVAAPKSRGGPWLCEREEGVRE